MRRSAAFPVASLCIVAAVSTAALGGCKRTTAVSILAREGTFAEMRAIKGSVLVTPPGEAKRSPYPRERLSEGEAISLGAGGLVWIRRDAGAVWLVQGPAELTLHADALRLDSGRAFVDGEDGPTARIDSPRGAVELEGARASVEIRPDGVEDVYVLRGAGRAVGSSERATSGELLSLTPAGVKRTAEVAWDDWTGGLATADPAAQPAPFGLGTVGARPPGDKGKPRFSLVIERLDVRVTVDHDLATTEVDQTFVNPSSDTVEGIFSFRTPPGAVLAKFGVDRDGSLVWGKVKESAAAQAQYESNVFQGSTEDPALLAWAGPGTYNARLYPIQPGAKRRVVTRYSEWLSRQGKDSDRRLYVYPMAAEGARGSLPRIEELRVTLDLEKAGASRVRAGMHGKTEGKTVTIQDFDFVPRADLAVELFDSGESAAVAYRAKHTLGADDIPMNADPKFAANVAKEEPDYLLVPLRSAPPADDAAGRGADFAIVVDTSAATESGALAIARSLTAAILAHLGPDDRAALWAGDASLRPVVDKSGELGVVDPATRRAWLAGLAGIERGGATDVGAILTEAASHLDPKRRGAVIYIGDGMPSVGEIAPKALRERIQRLPESTRIFAAGIGSRTNTALLDSITRGAPVESIGDAYGAARTALRFLEAAERPAWIGAAVDLGAGIDRVLPRDLPPVPSDESVLVVGRVAGKPPSNVGVTSGEAHATRPLRVVTLEDGGDLRRRWGQERLGELLGEGAGRPSLVDVARRYGLVSPYTSLYVPTAREAAEANAPENDEVATDRAVAIERRRFWRPWSGGALAKREPIAPTAASTLDLDRKEGGTGTRAKGEEGSMGNPASRTPTSRYAVKGPDAPPGNMNDVRVQDGLQAPASPPADAEKSRAAALSEAQEFGMIGALAASASPAPTAPWGNDSSAQGNKWGDAVGDSFGAGGLGLRAAGAGGGGRGEGIGLGNIGTIGHGAGTGQGLGKGGDRLGGNHMTKSPSLRQGATQVTGKLPPEVIQRIVRQNFGRFRLCYEKGLQKQPSLAGRISVRFVIDRNGAVATSQDGGSDMPDRDVVGCVVRGMSNLSFPEPEGGNVTVVYPILFAPGDGDAADRRNAAAVAAPEAGRPLGSIGHAPRPCGAGAELPLGDRRTLWSERLASATTAEAAIVVYRKALEDCEAPTWRERNALLLAMVDSLKSVSARVALWKSLIATPAADVVYRAIIVRVQSVAELKELHTALGLQSVDPDLLAGLLAKAKTPADRLSVLRAAAVKWSDDLELGLRVLDAYEDIGDEGGGRAWARQLRRRADATAHVWTSVGEYYLRLATRESGEGADKDRIEARRTFGELVEFSPDDPNARRRLGDLLRAHGWYDEALRQYATLQTLTPDDPAVPLLMAAAAQGLGRIEEAVGWAEKAASAGSPDGKSPLARAARATAALYLAWAHDDALRAGKRDDAERLLARARRIALAGADAGGAVTVVLSWSHPELHPSLWTSALGTPMPAGDNFPAFGVAEADMTGAGKSVELRLEPDDAARAARLGLKAVVTVVRGRGTPTQKVLRQEVGFGTVAAPETRLVVTLAGDALHVDAAPAPKEARR